MAALLMVVNSTKNPFQSVKVAFPERGHSYLPPDQVFGRVEKVYTWQELIKMSDSCQHSGKAWCSVRIIYNHWKPYHFKMFVSNHFVKQKIPIISTKIWLFKGNKPYVRCQGQYSSNAMRYDIRKRRSKALHTLRPKPLPPVSYLCWEIKSEFRRRKMV